MTRPYVLVAPNGARRGHHDHPALPVSVEEIVVTAITCQSAGADGLHLHVRDSEGQHSLDSGRYLETLAALKEAAPDLDLQITTEAVGVYGVPAQFECLQGVSPAWASISVREIARAPKLVDAIYGLCAEQATRVQHILYDAQDAALLNRWQAEGIVRPAQVDRLFVLGRYAAGQKSSPDGLAPFLQDGAPDAPWMVCAFGPSEHTCLVQAAALGGTFVSGLKTV